MGGRGARRPAGGIGSGLRFRGTPGWPIWLFLHIPQLIGFRSRLSVLVDWSWNYLTWEGHSRLIIPTEAGRAGAVSAAAPPSPAPLGQRRLAPADRRRLS